MPVEPSKPKSKTARLKEILLGYLEAARVFTWPGGDGLTVEDVLDFYPKAVAVGEVPDWQQLLRRHPELDPELHEWLATKDRWLFAFRWQLGASSPNRGESRKEK